MSLVITPLRGTEITDFDQQLFRAKYSRMDQVKLLEDSP